MTLLRPCNGPSPGVACPTDEYVPSGRCPACAAAYGRARGTTAARGYGTDHQRARDELREQLPAFCGYGCRTWIEPGDRWVAAHAVDGDPDAGYLISCPPCNERAKRRP